MPKLFWSFGARFHRDGLAGAHQQGRLIAVDRALKVIGLFAHHTVCVGDAQVVVCQCPVEREGFAG